SPTPPHPLPSPLSLHDALPIYLSLTELHVDGVERPLAETWNRPRVVVQHEEPELGERRRRDERLSRGVGGELRPAVHGHERGIGDRKSTRLNSSHVSISYAVFC